MTTCCSAGLTWKPSNIVAKVTTALLSAPCFKSMLPNNINTLLPFGTKWDMRIIKITSVQADVTVFLCCLRHNQWCSYGAGRMLIQKEHVKVDCMWGFGQRGRWTQRQRHREDDRASMLPMWTSQHRHLVEGCFVYCKATYHMWARWNVVAKRAVLQ